MDIRQSPSDQNPSVSPGAPKATPVPPSALTVLLVDDFQDAREMYAEFLEAHGFRTEQASDGHEALAKALALVPDLILMDLSLPGIDGWEVTRRLKGDPRTRQVAILALTAHALHGEDARARAAGCDGFITKPCLPEELLQRITASLRQRTEGTL